MTPTLSTFVTAAERDLRAVVRFFRWDLWAAHNAILRHAPDEWGHCRECGAYPLHMWPCWLHRLAQEAIEAGSPFIPSQRRSSR